MVYITGDCHAEFTRFSTRRFPEQKEMTKDDFVIICGDFGGVWDKETESRQEKNKLDWLQDKSFTTLFLDGNHENFDRLNSYPVEQWHGGKVHKIRESVIHLMRGQVYDIDGVAFFAFGGARSHDIDGGILDSSDPDFRVKRKNLNKDMISYRVNRVSWWEEELASDEEMAEGLANLAARGNKIDFIITHCAASSTQAVFGLGLFKPDRQTDYLEKIKNTVVFKRWFFGHYHDNRSCSENEIMLYDHIERIL